MLSTNTTIDHELDARPLGAFQLRVVGLCAIVAMIDGFDTQAIAFLAPAIAHAWGVPASGFGPVFGAGLLGGMLGAIGFGALGDRFGRKPALLASVLLFALASLATVLAGSIPELIGYRMVTGVGLGGAMPCIIALTSEYAPARMRSTLITSMFCGFPLGATIGGLGSAPLIAGYGWQSVLVVGGAIPLLLLPLLYSTVPESIAYLLRMARYVQANRILDRLRLSLRAEQMRGASDAPPAAGAAIASLFNEGRASGTLLLWVTFFLSLALTYFLVNWIPTVSRAAGMSLQGAMIGVAMLNLGAIFGCVLLGRSIDRFGACRVICLSYAAGAMAIAAIGFANSAVTLAICAFIAGFFAIGAQMCVVALAASFYSTSFRATGIGWSMGVGRIGGIAGPVVGGVLVGMGLAARDIFMFTAAVSLLAAASVFVMGRLPGQR